MKVKVFVAKATNLRNKPLSEYSQREELRKFWPLRDAIVVGNMQEKQLINMIRDLIDWYYDAKDERDENLALACVELMRTRGVTRRLPQIAAVNAEFNNSPTYKHWSKITLAASIAENKIILANRKPEDRF
jgi:hypothetical protein